MPGDFQSSFIPKEPTRKKRKRKASRGSLMGLLTIIIVILVILSTVGIFAYKKFLESRLNSKIEELKQVEDNLDPLLIDTFVKLDNRLKAAEGLLSGHIALSNLFEEIEDNTSHQVRFEDMSFDWDPIVGEHSLSMNGLARSFNAVAYQSDVFGDDPAFSNVVFSDLAVEEDTDNVTFNFAASVSSGLLDFEPEDYGFNNTGQ